MNNDESYPVMMSTEDIELEEELRRLKVRLAVARQQHLNGEVYSLDEVEMMMREIINERAQG